MTETVSASAKPDGTSDAFDHLSSDHLLVALQSLGVGVAVVGASGCLLSADDLFCTLHKLTAPHTNADLQLENWSFENLLSPTVCGMANADAHLLTLAWKALTENTAGGTTGQHTVRLGDGRTLRITCAALSEGPAVLTAADVTEQAKPSEQSTPPSRLVHDMNNLLGAVLANLHLCLADIEADHPVRSRLETINRAAIDMRTLVKENAR